MKYLIIFECLSALLISGCGHEPAPARNSASPASPIASAPVVAPIPDPVTPPSDPPVTPSIMGCVIDPSSGSLVETFSFPSPPSRSPQQVVTIKGALSCQSTQAVLGLTDLNVILHFEIYNYCQYYASCTIFMTEIYNDGTGNYVLKTITTGTSALQPPLHYTYIPVSYYQ